jgi:DNA-binding NarL/FixJ family response regulator
MGAPIVLNTPTLAASVPNLPPPPPRRRCPLSPIELDVLRQYAEGHDNEGAARVLGRKLATVQSVGKRMLVKSATANRVQLVAVALRNGWIQ